MKSSSFFFLSGKTLTGRLLLHEKGPELHLESYPKAQMMQRSGRCAEDSPLQLGPLGIMLCGNIWVGVVRAWVYLRMKAWAVVKMLER